MLKKIAIAACFGSALAMLAAPANAGAVLVAGKWYYFSLDYDAEVKKVTGKELNSAEGVKVTSAVKIEESEIACGNPAGNLIRTGNGPTLSTSATTNRLGDEDIIKTDRSKSSFKKTVAVDLLKDAPAGACDSPSQGSGEWQPLYWRYDECLRGTQTGDLPICYSDLAYKSGSTYIYATGDLKGTQVPPAEVGYWTLVYLPTEFTYTSTVSVDGTNTGGLQGRCNFTLNTDPNARFPNDPYSLDNPPVGGWAKSGTDYQCGVFSFVGDPPAL